MKRCTQCNQIKQLSDFHTRNDGKFGVRSNCKECRSAASKIWYIKNADNQKKSAREWDKKNRQRKIELGMIWRSNNTEKIKAYARKTAAKIRSTSKGKLNAHISREVARYLKKGSKNGRPWETLVSWDINQLKSHLEKQFLPGMTWENYGTHWHVDHIIPKSAFNYETPEDVDFKRCWELNNLQPMWAKDNISKGVKIERPLQPTLLLG